MAQSLPGYWSRGLLLDRPDAGVGGTPPGERARSDAHRAARLPGDARAQSAGSCAEGTARRDALMHVQRLPVLCSLHAPTNEAFEETLENSMQQEHIYLHLIPQVSCPTGEMFLKADS